MNRHILRVFTTYLLALLTLCFYLPWYGRPVEPWADLPVFLYAPLWHPPRTLGYLFYLDIGRLALAFFSLSAIMAAAVISLWGKDEENR